MDARGGGLAYLPEVRRAPRRVDVCWYRGSSPVGVDLDTDHGNSAITVDGADVPGELMMWLELLPR